ncbi:MAG: hypothetical protein RJB66_1767 [Pseudomonadota bacterium]|jgi:hypothetical protein
MKRLAALLTATTILFCSALSIATPKKQKDLFAHRAVDWPKDGQLDFCGDTNAFDYRTAYWMAAFSHYSYLDPLAFKQIIDAPRGKKVTVTLRKEDGSHLSTEEMYGLGWKGHFDFFTSKPVLPKKYKSTVRNILSLVGANMPYEACIKKEKRHCHRKDHSTPPLKGEECEQNLEKTYLDRSRLRNVAKLAKGEPLSAKAQQQAETDRESIEAEVRRYEQQHFVDLKLAELYEDPHFEVSCENFRYTRDLPPDVQALWLDGPKNLIIAFRGTEGDNAIDWATDFATSFQSKQAYLPFWERNVHKGFQNAFEILSKWLYEEIDDFFERYTDASQTPVIITGHSMGGAIATIVSAALMERNTKVPFHKRLNLKALYTFGSPRVGNEYFSQYFDALRNIQEMGYYRVVNKNDIVTKAPCGDYLHIGSHIQLLADVQGNFPAMNVQILANPQSEEFGTCAYGTQQLFDNLSNFKQYTEEHLMPSYYSVLVRARQELHKSLHRQAADYEKRFGPTSEEENPYNYPKSCEARRIYDPKAPSYLQLNYKQIAFEIEK